jgi:hypothetical protein
MLRATNVPANETQAEPCDRLESELAGSILGSLNVARYCVLVGSPLGVLLTPLVQPSNLVAKPLPLLQIPPAPQRFLGRVAAVEAAIAAIQAGQSVQVVAGAGLGKATFLRYLAHRLEVTTSHPDGILYVSRVQAVEDLVQTIGERFYVIYPDSKLMQEEWQVSLQELQILIILADAQWLPEDVQQLRQVFGQSTFLLAGRSSRSLPDCVTIKLPVLSLPETRELAQQVWGRSLDATDERWVELCWQRFQGHPARLVQLFELLRQGKWDWAGCQQRLWGSGVTQRAAAEQLLRQTLDTLSTPQRWILGLLCALDGVGLTVGQIAAMTGPQEPQSSLQGLLRLALVQQFEGRYRVADYVRVAAAKQFDSEPWMARGADVLVEWLKGQPPELVLPEVPVVMAFLGWAVRQQRWELVLQLARSVDAVLVLGKLWEEWRRSLQWALQAAWQLADRSAEAWAWHQMGVRALCLEDVTTAYDALQQSLRLRQELGDPQAIALTQRHLGYAVQGAMPSTVRSEVRSEVRRRRVSAMLVVISLVTFGLSVLGGLVVKDWLGRMNPVELRE